MGPGLEAERFRSLHRFGSLPEAILAARRMHGSAKVVLEDIEGNALTYGQLALAGAVLERALRARFPPGDRVGLLLPTAPGAAAVLLGFWRAGRVPAMLNPTVGVGPMLSALRIAGYTTVISSRAYVDKGGLGELVEAVRAAGFDLLWTEDLKAAVTRFDKLAGFFGSRITPRDLRRETEAAVLFTSGTEGAPKGVVLTHGNLLANVAQLQARAPIGPTDRVVSALPLFHSFGLTAGLVLMLATGIRTGLHPSPLHYRVIPELVKRLQATILIGTDTFLTAWGRRATAEHFASLRAVVAGAEPVKATTRADWSERFGVTILEGYGATETSPVLALNDLEDQRIGTVGRLLPGIEHRLEPVAGVDGSRLLVRGPNVMVGYLRPEGGGRIEPPEDGWYDTGDIVRMRRRRSPDDRRQGQAVCQGRRRDGLAGRGRGARCRGLAGRGTRGGGASLPTQGTEGSAGNRQSPSRSRRLASACAGSRGGGDTAAVGAAHPVGDSAHGVRQDRFPATAGPARSQRQLIIALVAEETPRGERAGHKPGSTVLAAPPIIPAGRRFRQFRERLLVALDTPRSLPRSPASSDNLRAKLTAPTTGRIMTA